MREILNLIMLVLLFIVSNSAKVIIFLGQSAPVLYMVLFAGVFLIGLYNLREWIKARRWMGYK